MLYESTRGEKDTTCEKVVCSALAADGGLYVPREIPRLSAEQLEELSQMPHMERAEHILGLFFDKTTAQRASKAYEEADFSLAQLGGVYALELFNGPTGAFKDMALQALPAIISEAKRDKADDINTLVLTATSGDTGAAALSGFLGKADTSCFVFYPEQGISPIQRAMMNRYNHNGGNVACTAVRGNFDDAQRVVKSLFADKDFNAALSAMGYELSSANSINFGRMAPQIVYYISAYLDLVAMGEINMGEAVNVAVPTGNFGNILSAWYAKRMGVPFGRFICCSNRNDVLYDFLGSGVYDARRPFVRTLAPSMDILVSSNLERLLYELSGRDAAYISELMQSIASLGSFEVRADIKQALQDEFLRARSDDADILRTIRDVYDTYGYLADPHTAVALRAAGQYPAAKTLVAATATPFKFPETVLRALGQESSADARADAEKLSVLTSQSIPPSIEEVVLAPAEEESICDISAMAQSVLNFAQNIMNN